MIALNCADYACILQDNRVVVVGAGKELAKNEEVKKFYPGLSAAGRNSLRDIKTLSAPKAIAGVMRP
jgi:branched-chain amino acid transport system ATP-binding protein